MGAERGVALGEGSSNWTPALRHEARLGIPEGCLTSLHLVKLLSRRKLGQRLKASLTRILWQGVEGKVRVLGSPRPAISPNLRLRVCFARDDSLASQDCLDVQVSLLNL